MQVIAEWCGDVAVAVTGRSRRFVGDAVRCRLGSGFLDPAIQPML